MTGDRCPQGRNVERFVPGSPLVLALAVQAWPFPPVCTGCASPSHMPSRSSYFHLHLISDSTGETLTTVARAATAQYRNVSPVEHVYPLVRTQKQLDRILEAI